MGWGLGDGDRERGGGSVSTVHMDRICLWVCSSPQDTGGQVVYLLTGALLP